MPVATTLVGKPDKRGGTLTAYVTLVFSGTYPTGGEPLDFNTIVGYTSRQPKSVQIAGKAGFVYQYDSANKKIFVYCNTAGGANAALGEHTNAGYVAGVTGDAIVAELIWGL